MTSFPIRLIVRAIKNFRESHRYSIIKNLLALPRQVFSTQTTLQKK